jgi:hypothetical protein
MDFARLRLDELRSAAPRCALASLACGLRGACGGAFQRSTLDE